MQVRFIEEGDIARCNDFHNRAYGTSRTVEQWHWLFNRRIAGRRAFILAEEDGHIVGTQALMPMTMIDANGPIKTAKSEETLIDPSMRGRGVFPMLYEPLLELARSAGVQAIWGFTPAKKPFEQIGFAIPARTAQLVLPLSTRAADAFAGHLGSGARATAMRVGIQLARAASSIRFAVAHRNPEWLRISALDAPPDAAALLCARFVGGWGGVTVLRDNEYLDWRFFRNPFVRATVVGAYRGDDLLGWLAYSLDESSMGYIVDAIVPPASDPVQTKVVVRALLTHVVLRLRACGAVAIRSWSVGDHPFAQLFRSVSRGLGFYFVQLGEPVVVHPTGGSERPASLADWNGWYVTRAFTQGESG